MVKRRALPVSVVIGLVATLLPLLPAAAGAQAPGSRDPGLLGQGARGTGVLPNFAAEGSNLIRLQVGAFDPVVDSPPAPAGIPLVNEATLPAPTAQYWLVQVKDNQFPAVADAVTAAGGLIVG